MISHDEYRARTYLPELDGLRAVSVLLVVTAHMTDKVWRWLGGGQGVSVFFVLSGYLITMLALREVRARGHLNIRAFFLRRVFRLFPLYYFVLGTYCVMILGLRISVDKRDALLEALPYYVLYFQEYPFYLGVHAPPFGHAWSLGIEEKFYLVWPFVAFGASGFLRSHRIQVTVVLTLLTMFAPAIVGERLGQFVYWYSHILVGCLVAIVLDSPAGFARVAWLGRRRAASLSLLVFVAIHFIVPTVSPGLHRVFMSLYAVAVGVFVISIVLHRGSVRKVLEAPILVKIGRLSYGIYLIHRLTLNLAETVARPGTGNVLVSVGALVLASVLSTGVAYMLARTIEQPGIALGRRISSKLLSAAGSSAAA
jgi:peptidoglycan/LPS O-acetylase OafA/YrhL